MQKFRLDYQGSRDLDPNNESIYTFKVPRHADLLMDAYFVFTIPDIWSTILPPTIVNDCWKPYHFKWIENLGTSMIKKIRILIGTQVIQEYNGEYIRCMAERDFTEDKNYQALLRITEFLQKKNIKICFITTPWHKDFREKKMDMK